MKLFAAVTAACLAALVFTPAQAGGQVQPQGQSGAAWAGANLIQTTDTGTVATLTVPAVSPNANPGSDAAVWVGVDGAAGTQSLVQTGIDLAPASDGGNGAWWTTCGTWAGGQGCSPQPIQASVQAGDQIRMAVAHVGDCRWRMSLTDMRGGSRAWWWGSTISYCAYGPRTVEWVAEGWAPGIPWPLASPAVFRNIWLQRADGRWSRPHLTGADALYSNVMTTVAEERSGVPQVCAQGHAWHQQVAIDFLNAC